MLHTLHHFGHTGCTRAPFLDVRATYPGVTTACLPAIGDEYTHAIVETE